MKTRMKELRAKYNLTQEDLAKLVGVRRETIVFLERGNYNPPLRLSFAIARTLHVRVDEVFSFDDETDSSEPL